MTTLSTHVLDTERGTPAQGLHVALYREADCLVRAETDSTGRIGDLAGALQPGSYRLEFEVAGYLQAQGRAAPFLQTVTLEFLVDGSQPHYHVPLLMTPYACTSYRGS